MRIAVLGAGAMGSWIGGQLAASGHTVSLLTTNAAHIKAVRNSGLILRTRNAEIIVKPEIYHPDEFSDEISGPIELVITLTKTFQLEAALSSIAGLLTKETAVLSLQNGLGNAEIIAAYVGMENTWIGVTMLPVDKIAPGIVQCMGQGTTWFGQVNDNNSQMTAKIAAAFSSTSLDVQRDPHVMQRIWEKVAFNAGMNAVCALSNATPGSVGSYGPAKELVKSAAAEVASVAMSQGVSLDLQAVYKTIDFACEKHRNHVPSMRQDLLDGRKTEVGAIHGAITERARRAGVGVPVNKMLETLITLAERSVS